MFSAGETHTSFSSSPFTRRYPAARLGTMSASLMMRGVLIPKRLEIAVMEKVAVKLSGDAMNQNPRRVRNPRLL